MAPFLIIVLAAAIEFHRLPSAGSLDVFLPDDETTVTATSSCTQAQLDVLPATALTPFFPALTAAEGHVEDETSELLQLFSTSLPRSGHYASSISRTMLCQDSPHLHRALDEMLLSIAVKARYSRQQILTVYLNRIYFGGGQIGIAGIAQASHFYFNKPPDKLDLPARALLVGLIQSPNRLSPFKHPDRALARRNLILDTMLAEHSITLEEATAAKAAPLPTAPKP